jgi:hypothetical protein
MTRFQIVALTLVAGVLAAEIIRGSRFAGRSWTRLFRCLVWLGAGLAIAFPGLVQDAANLLGIGRGTDVVLYFLVLAFLWTAFYFYTKQMRLQMQLTDVVRHLALLGARREKSVAQEQQSPLGNQ